MATDLHLSRPNPYSSGGNNYRYNNNNQLHREMKTKLSFSIIPTRSEPLPIQVPVPVPAPETATSILTSVPESTLIPTSIPASTSTSTSNQTNKTNEIEKSKESVTTNTATLATNTTNLNTSLKDGNCNADDEKNFDETDNKPNELLDVFDVQVRYTMNDRFHSEVDRLKTFDNWPLDFMDKYKLAQTGMFYTGEGDKTKCYFCEVEIGRWERTDEPLSEHWRWSPNCPLLRRRTTNNVPISAEALERILPPVSYDICGLNDHISGYTDSNNITLLPEHQQQQQQQYCSTAVPSSSSASSSSTLNLNTSATSTASASATTTYYPEYPEYAIESARIRSFAEWPRNMKQKAEQLAEAGFFYTGLGDRVKCFSCGGGLKDWDDTDEPWEQHALWLSKCRFLKLIKGQSYIDAVLEKQKSKDAEHDQHNADDAANTYFIDHIESNRSQNADVVGVAATVEQSPLVKPDLVTATNAVSAEIAETAATSEGTIAVAAATTGTAKQSENFIANALATNYASATASAIPEEKLCKICYGSEYNTAFLPCGHVVACAKCASSVTKCPLCRKPFTDVMRVYFS